MSFLRTRDKRKRRVSPEDVLRDLQQSQAEIRPMILTSDSVAPDTRKPRVSPEEVLQQLRQQLPPTHTILAQLNELQIRAIEDLGYRLEHRDGWYYYFRRPRPGATT
jgi:hypothetical protein